jgi:HEAT repeat protein
MTDFSPTPTIFSTREIKLHLGGLVLFMAALVLWYWGSTGARAVPTLIEMLTNDDPSTRIVAAEQLGLVGPAAAAAVPALLAQATKDGSQHANTTAAAALKSIDLTAARMVMTHFIARVQDPDVQQRRTACAVLGSLGPVAKPAVTSLLAVANDADELVRRNALTSLASIGIPSLPVAAALIAGLHAPSSLVRHSAVAQFAFTTPVPQEAEEPLKALLADQDRAIAGLARSALDKPRPDDVSHLQSLGLMVEQPTARDYALHQLAQLGPAAGQALGAVVPMLQDERPLVRYLAAEALGAMGPGAKEALPPLKQQMHDPDSVVRASIAEAVAAIESGTTTPTGAPSKGSTE